ncbi:MAG: ATP-binding protein [Candidatus Omnitrophota bacterium]
MNPYFISLAFTSVSSFALGLFVWLKNRDSTINKTWFLTCVAVSMWSLCMAIYVPNPISYKSALLLGKLTNIFATFIPIFFTHFSLAFVGRKTLKNKMLLFGYLFCLFILCVGFSSYFVPSVRPWRNFYYYVTPGVFFHAHTVSFAFFTIYAEYVLFKGLKYSSPSKRNQIKYMLISTSAAFICGSFAFFGVYGINITTLPIHFVFLYVLTISYAIVKHNLWDINIVIRKGLIYSALISLITVSYIIIALLVETLFRGIIGYKSLPITIFTITLLVIFFQPLKNRIQKIIDKYFFHGTIDQIDEENIKLREELQKSEKLKAVATLAAGMAHEIKNPLTSIKTFTEYLSEKKNDPEFFNKFQKIVGGEVGKINDIVQQLLEFSKPKDLQLKEVSINNLLEETLILLSNDFLKNNIKVERSLATTPSIKVDSSQMKQVFVNILLNAIDSMKNGGTIKVETRSDKNISIAIKDTGKGIDKEDLKRIFDPFFSKKDNGTGLGLSVVHGIIEKHGGKINVESIPNIGTSFKITLPVTYR